MFGDHFYHSTIRKGVAIFGTLFNNITVVRRNGSDEAINQIKVPLAYGSKQKFLNRLDTIGDDQKSMALKLPRMAFTFNDIAFDPTFKMNKMTALSNGTGSTRDTIKLQTSYMLNFELNIMAKNQDDALQIVEQIMPYFHNEYSVTIRPIDGWTDLKEDIPITLNGITMSDENEGASTDRRVLVYTLDFSMKMKFYGPTGNQGVITSINIEFRDDFDISHDAVFDDEAETPNNLSDLDIS